MQTEQILRNLTTEEKARLLNGVGSWHTYDCNGKLPQIMMSDGPHGLRKQDKEDYADINHSEIATCFPTASAVACSFDTEVVKKMAKAIANEAKKEQISIVLGCGVNMKRSPLCGRNFEYFSEDPFLAGTLAAAYIGAMEEEGVGTSLKHFAGNNQESKRQTQNSQIDERALREIYLTAFEMAVKEGKPSTIMASYNRLNGQYACANPTLLTDILRKEWGYTGAVISDWGATADVVACVKAGLDLEMPESDGYHTKQLLEAVADGRLRMEELDRAAENVIRLVEKCDKNKITNATVDYEEQHQIAKEIACESAVLLKNDGILPLAENETVLVVGELAEHMRFQGSGSSHITTAQTKNALEALKDKGINVVYTKGYENSADEEDEALIAEAVSLAGQYSKVLLFCGLTERFEGEGYDRMDMKLPRCQRILAEKLCEVNKQVAAVTFGGAPMEIAFADKVQAILHMYLSGQAVGEAVAALLTGEVNPSGKLAETFPMTAYDAPMSALFTTMGDDVEYRESIFIGYRYYETFSRPVRYEFGHGLSYTTFAYSDIVLDKASFSEGTLTVLLTVTNTGTRFGKEIVQIYVVPPYTDMIRAKKELKAFTKVALAPGEAKCVTLTLTERSFSIYDTKTKAFVMPSGNYRVEAGASVRDIRLSAEVNVEGIVLNRNDKKEFPSYFPQEDKPLLVDKEQFGRLYNQPLSKFNSVKRGGYTIYNSLETVANASLFGKIVMGTALMMLKRMYKGKSVDDPEVKMVLTGAREGMLDSLVSMSGGMLKRSLAESLVLFANRHYLKGFARLFHT